MDLQTLYQELILEYSRNPRNFGKPQHYTHSVRGFNPLCGDDITIYVTLEDNKLKDLRFHGTGCSISIASASLMTELLTGKTISEALSQTSKFLELVQKPFSEDIDLNQYGNLAAFAGVRAFPSRVKCATLAWHALEEILKHPEQTQHKQVSTE